MATNSRTRQHVNERRPFDQVRPQHPRWRLRLRLRLRLRTTNPELNNRYKFEDRCEVQIFDVFEWTNWHASSRSERLVSRTYVEDNFVGTKVTGTNTRIDDGPPLVFETKAMPLYALDDHDWIEYSTWDEAERGHAKIVAEIRARTVGRNLGAHIPSRNPS